MTSSMRDLKVYTTYPHSCSYLEEQEATTLFVDPRQAVDKNLYSNLSVLGFGAAATTFTGPTAPTVKPVFRRAFRWPVSSPSAASAAPGSATRTCAWMQRRYPR